MQTTTNSAREWANIIGGLSSKQQAAEDHREQLTTEKSRLALAAAMGDANAKKRLVTINQELAKADLEGDDWASAIAQAELARTMAERTEAEASDRARHAHIGASLTQYLAEVRAIDKNLAALAVHFTAAKECLDAAEAKMVGKEGAPIRQLRSAYGPTIAAAHFGLGAFIELGAASSNIKDRQPLEGFAKNFCDRWLKPNQEEATSGD